MLSLTLKSIRANKARFFLTGVAVILGVAFMAGHARPDRHHQEAYDDVAGQRLQVHRRRRAFRPPVDGTTTARTRGTDRRLRSLDRSAQSTACSGRGPAARHRASSSATTASSSTPTATGDPDRAWRGRTTPALNPMELVAGHAPAAADEVVIDRASADKGHFAVGETVQRRQPGRLAAVPARRRRDLRRRRRRRRRPGGGVHARDTAATVLGTPGRYTPIQVVAAPGVSQAARRPTLRDRARTIPTSRSITGAAGDRRGPQGDRARRCSS